MGNILFILALGLAVILATLLGCLHNSLSTLSTHELKQRARAKQKGARGAYALHARGYEVIVGLIILRVLLSVIVVSIVVKLVPLPWSILVATILLSASTEIVGRFYLREFVLRRTDFLFPVLQKLLLLMLPISRPLGRVLDKRFKKYLPVIHSRDHLIEVLDSHKASVFSDIEAEQIEIVKSALSFGDKQVRAVMTPKSEVKSVAADSTASPVIMDELHKSGHSRFPVWGANDSEVVGTLLLRRLTNLKETHGKIRDYMDKQVYYVHEELPLGHVLQAFLKTKHHIFIVVNNFEEMVGIITLEDVIEQIIGKPVMDEFDEYENLREVAQLRAKKDHAKNDHAKTEEKVVE